jgi:hypothetical protein
MVALDLSKHDAKLIRYSKYIINAFGIPRAIFTHVIPIFNLLSSRTRTYRDWLDNESLEDIVRKKIKNEIQDLEESLEDCKTQVQIGEGRPYHQLLESLEKNHIDLLESELECLCNYRLGSGSNERKL